MAFIDSDDLRRIFDEHSAALALYARQWCVVPDDAVQESFIALVQQSPAPDEPLNWLYTTVRYRAMNLARSDSRREKYHRLASDQRAAWFECAQDTALSAADLQLMLEALPDSEREIVVARIWGDLSFEQIASLVKLPASSVHRRYRSALAKLKKHFCGETGQARLIK